MKKQLLTFAKNAPFLLHLLAGIILVTFALSHFAFLIIYDNSRDSINPVFPFLHNGNLYFCAGIFELATSLVCFFFPARHLTNLVILGFVTAIVWYKMTFYVLGGIECGCLGLLGRLLHVSKLQEQIIPDIALLLLSATTSPWVIAFLKRFRRSVDATPPRAIVFSFLVLLLLIAPTHVLRARTMSIKGEVDSAHYNPVTGKIFTNDHVHAVFSVVISDNAWKICITNQIDKTRWSRFIWDGSNAYLFQPNGGNFYSHKPPLDDSTLVTISSSPVYDSLDQDDIGMSPLWLTYGFSPIAAVTNNNGVIDLPLNWRGTRSSMQAYGYKWLIGEWLGTRFIDRIDVVRDSTLDLDSKRELLRNSMDYPETLVSFNVRNEGFAFRSEVKNGFLEATYRCIKWYKTNELSIPWAAEFKWYLPPGPTTVNEKPAYIASLNANSFSISGGDQDFVESQIVENKSVVHDYRYKTANETRIFKYAQYDLQAGEHFKSGNDPALKAIAKDWLIHGKKYGFYSNRKQVLSWLLLAALLAPAIILVWRKQTKT